MSANWMLRIIHLQFVRHINRQQKHTEKKRIKTEREKNNEILQMVQRMTKQAKEKNS